MIRVTIPITTILRPSAIMGMLHTPKEHRVSNSITVSRARTAAKTRKVITRTADPRDMLHLR